MGSFLCCAEAEPPIWKVPFEKFKLVVTNTSSVRDVFEAERTENGAKLVYYNEFMGSVNDKAIVRELNGGWDLLEKMDSLWKKGMAAGWNGFNGPNPPGMLDGGGFIFDATLVDGTKVKANGTNNYPKGYGDFERGLYELTTRSILDATTFAGKYFQVTLPESWVGLVEIGYGANGNSFVIPRKNGSVYFMRIEVSADCESRKGYRCLGKIKGQDLYVNWYSYEYTYFQKYMEESHWKAYDDFVKNLDSIIKSVAGVGGIEIEPVVNPLP